MKKNLLSSAVVTVLLCLGVSSAFAQTPSPQSSPQNSLPTNPLGLAPNSAPGSVAQPVPAPGQYQGYDPAATTNPYAAQVPVQQPQAYGQPVPVSVPPTSLPPMPPAPTDFEVAVSQNMPLSPDQIRELARMLDERQKAAALPLPPPRSVTGSVSVSLDPGSTPPVIRPFIGVNTSFVVLDSTGAPWPVENHAVGNGMDFKVERLDGPGGSTFVISALRPYGQSNLILKLAGHPTPVVLNLVSGQREVDARVEVRIQGRGPNASVTSVPLTPAVDSRLMSVLDGVPPAGRPVAISGDAKTRAWLMPNGRLWLRTDLTVISPAPISFVSASDGTRAYELPAAARILSMMNEQFVTLDVTGCLQECANLESDW